MSLGSEEDIGGRSFLEHVLSSLQSPESSGPGIDPSLTWRVKLVKPFDIGQMMLKSLHALRIQSYLFRWLKTLLLCRFGGSKYIQVPSEKVFGSG